MTADSEDENEPGAVEEAKVGLLFVAAFSDVPVTIGCEDLSLNGVVDET